MPSSLTAIDRVKVSNLQQVLSRLSSAILYIHRLQIQTSMDKKYYDELDLKPADPVNKAKIYEARIDQSSGLQQFKIHYIFQWYCDDLYYMQRASVSPLHGARCF